MKKKILLFFALVSIVACLFAIAVSAETPSMYIEFGARFPGSDEYITVYTQNAESSGNPRINFKDYKFYSNVEFTNEVDISTVTGLDFSVAVSHNSAKPVNRITNPSSPFVNCTEVKWFTQDKAMNNEIPTSMFNGWSGLKSFDFGNARVLGDNAFQGCGFETLVIPSTVTRILNSTFAKNLSLTSVKFEGVLDSIGSSTFNKCTSLKDVDLGQLTAIGGGMFIGCTQLESITVPSSIKTIGNEAMLTCTALSSVTLNEGLTKIGSRVFEGTAITQITIPNSVVEICEKSFYGVTSLNSVVISNDASLETIGNNAFYNVPASNLTVPSTVTSIGGSAFRNSGITTVVIPAGVTSVGNEAFANCTSLTSVVFEQGFKGTLGSSAFLGTSALTTLTLVEGITSIPYQCFYHTGEVDVVIPNSVTSLASRAFSESSVKSITISENSQLATIAGAFNSTSIKSIYLPTGVKITESPFSQCHKLEYIYNLENAVIETSAGLNVIPNNFFNESRALKEIKLPNGITSIGSGVFSRCGGDGCTLIYIPASVTKIDKGAFPGTNDWLSPKKAVIFYCGGDAQKLLSLTDDGEGNVSSFLKDRITNNQVAAYAGLKAEYAQGVIVEYANSCDMYYGGVHTESTEIIYTYVDENGNPNGLKFLSTLNVASPCGRECGKETVIKTIAPLFRCLGFSANETGSAGIVLGFHSDVVAISEYETFTGKTLEFGLFAVSSNNLGDKYVLNADGSETEGVVKANTSRHAHAAFEIKLVGFTTDKQKETAIVLGAYVIENNGESIEITYLQDEPPADGAKYSYVTYNEIVK